MRGKGGLALEFTFYDLSEIFAVGGEEDGARNAGIKNKGIAAFLANGLDDTVDLGEDRLEELLAFLEDRKFDLLLFGLEVLLFFLELFLAGLGGHLGKGAGIDFFHKESGFGLKGFSFCFKWIHYALAESFQLAIGSDHLWVGFNKLC